MVFARWWWCFLNFLFLESRKPSQWFIALVIVVGERFHASLISQCYPIEMDCLWVAVLIGSHITSLIIPTIWGTMIPSSSSWLFPLTCVTRHTNSCHCLKVLLIICLMLGNTLWFCAIAFAFFMTIRELILLCGKWESTAFNNLGLNWSMSVTNIFDVKVLFFQCGWYACVEMMISLWL
jgi:hypothetical protein